MPPNMTTSAPETEISTDKLGPAGTSGDLLVVALMEDETRRDQDRLQDSTTRPFKVFARLGKTPPLSDRVKGDFDANDGESYLSLPQNAVAGRVRLNDGMMEFRKNTRGEKSLVIFECDATSLLQAKNKFLDFALPFLDYQAYVANCPIFIQSIRVEDVNNQVQSIDYISPYRTGTISEHLIEVTSELAPIFAMYREAKNSHSDFYKFLCYHKIMDGLLGTLRANINFRARKLNVTLTQARDLVPNDPDIAGPYTPNCLIFTL